MAPLTGARLQRAGRHPLVAPLAGVVVLHLLGFGLLLAVAVRRELVLGSGELFGAGLGLTAYALGMRHAFDADHIAAIDNTARKLLAEGRRPDGAGFFFAAGHSTVVLVLVVLVALGVRGVGGAVLDEGSTLHRVASVWGPLVAGTFLLAIAYVNIAVLRRSLATARSLRAGELAGDDLRRRLAEGHGSALAGLSRRFSSRVTRSWHLYPVGLLFGLGFDTATEIALLVLAGGGAATGVPLPALLSLPLLFAAGMTLLDTLNGALMTRAYDGAQRHPARRVAYDITVTGASVVFALTVGALSVIGVVTEQLQIDSGPLAWLAAIDAGLLAFAVLGIALTAWGVLALRWHRTPLGRGVAGERAGRAPTA